MQDVEFSREEVEARAGKQPWTRQRLLRTEINPDDMAETAAIYARAAAEARGAQDLAAIATRISQEAGELDTSTIVDGEGRIHETGRDLQRGGDDIDQVTMHIGFAMNAALDTEEKVHDLIFGPEGLEQKYLDHLRAARAEWEGWGGALQSAVDEYNKNPLYAEVPLPVLNNSRLEYAPMSGTDPAGGPVFALPDTLPQEIRELHLDAAAKDASNYHREIEEEIEIFRLGLMGRASDLMRLGYDPSQGPFDLFTSVSGPPRIVESEKTFNPRERAIAELLYSEGRYVYAVRESTIHGQQTADSLVNGVPTEFKSLDPGAVPGSIRNAINKAKNQARDAVVDARGSGLSEAEARQGLDKFFEKNHPSQMDHIRIVGDGYNIEWP
ncbi:CdiA C-terminal domain-containing protein [Streptomyces sp. 6N223]|uniref:CdiA C-terminal domain-containing protein n=1 Tax=Streptomyces sp. 6N223 TaxID=3457412 RepID=UPI003FD42F05